MHLLLYRRTHKFVKQIPYTQVFLPPIFLKKEALQLLKTVERLPYHIQKPSINP